MKKYFKICFYGAIYLAILVGVIRALPAQIVATVAAPAVDLGLKDSELVVLLGGLSCIGTNNINARQPTKTDLYQNVRARFSEKKVKIISVCFANMTDVVFELDETTGEKTSMRANQFKEFLGQIINSNLDTQINLVGYSFGAGLAFDVLQYVDERAKINLITVDAINKDTCQPIFYFAHLGKHFAGLTTSGCSYEIDQPKRVAHWTNFYQKSYPVLHGRVFSQADDNVLISGTAKLDPHRDIDQNELVLQEIVKQVAY